MGRDQREGFGHVERVEGVFSLEFRVQGFCADFAQYSDSPEKRYPKVMEKELPVKQSQMTMDISDVKRRMISL